MANLSNLNMSHTAAVEIPKMTLDELLDSLGFKLWQITTTTFAPTTISFLGLIFCSISAWIFFQRKFKDSVFFYYRLLTLIFIFHLFHIIPSCLFYTPKYFPSLNTYLISMYQLYYGWITNALFQYEDILQICILLTKMKTFNKFLKKNFTLSPKLISSFVFLVCLVINLPILFLLKITNLGDYFYTDINGSTKKASFYFINSSDFSQSLIGQFVSVVIYFILSILLGLIVGLILNTITIIQYRRYLQFKRAEEVGLQLKYFDIQNSARVEVVVPYKFSQKRLNERKAEKEMLYMILTLCSVSIISRIVITILSISIVFFYNTQIFLISDLIFTLIFTLTPTVSIFIFHSFNKAFRQEFKKIISFKKQNEMKCSFKFCHKF
jgi:hypothetical protein